MPIGRSQMLLACLVEAWLLWTSSFALAAEEGQQQPDVAPAEAKRFSRPVLIRFEGMISPMSQQYLLRKLESARQQRADLVVIEIDSPGGYVNASIEIAEHLRDLKWAHTVAFVPKESLSGAAIAALGCDEIVMHPQAKFGDAGPIYMDEAGMFQHAHEKIRSHLARHVRDLAQAKGRSPAIAEAMVDKDLVVFRVREKETEREAFMTEAELRAEEKPDRWEKVAPLQEAGAGNFLEVNGKRAVELKFAQGLAGDRQELHERFKLDVEWQVMQPGRLDSAVQILNHPLITGLLILLGLVALYVELSAPGTFVGGLFAGLCFSLFFWSRFLGGTSGWLEVVLFMMGAIFFAIEIFVLPGFGVAGFTGLGLMAVSLIMASQDFVIPHSPAQMQTFSTTLFVLIGTGLAFTVTAVLISRRFKSIPVFNRMVLAPPSSVGGSTTATDQGSQKSSSAFSAPVRVGDRGTADSPLRPAGKALIENNYVDVVADGAFVDKGSRIRVVKVQGNRVVVREEPS